MSSQITIKSDKEIELMQEACSITAAILDAVGEIIKPGVTTEQIDQCIHKMMEEAGAVPATLNYHGYPKSSCTSVNEVVCHGIPSQFQVLRPGDIINVDVTSIKKKFHGDASRMYMVGGKEACSPEAVELIDHTLKALQAAIDVVRPGAKFGDIGAAIEEYVAASGKRYGIVREYTGHGIGREFHEPPQVLHVGKKGTGPEMKEGMTFTIEPMINLGTAKTVLSKMDGWTVRTADNKLSAQWEHTLLVTSDGAKKLTQSLNGQDY